MTATASGVPEVAVRPGGVHWTNLLFLVAAHLLGVVGLIWVTAIEFRWPTVAFALVWGWMSGLSITGGYHRLFSHASYQASWLLRLFYLLLGAACVQNSALTWSADHRNHHAHTDDDRDPYNIRRGFWWAHIGWVCHKGRKEPDFNLVRDLLADPLVMFQHRFYVPLAIVFGAALPTLIGMTWGDPLGGFFVAGWLRLVLLWHATFSINSVTHSIGKQTYCRRGSARDSGLVALITLGEGYHNFHHRFQIDYRNGVRWYHFDPTKWWIWSMAQVGLARGLRRVPTERIDAARRAARAAELSAGAR